MNHRTQTIFFVFVLFATGSALAKEATISGRAVLKSGVPAAGAEIIVKDSWAGLFVMREKVLFRTRTNELGEFSVPPIKYRHTLDFLIVGKPCSWWTGNGRVSDADQSAPGVYHVTFVLLDDSCGGGPAPPTSGHLTIHSRGTR